MAHTLRALERVPQLAREERKGLAQHFEQGGEWDLDYVVMMGLSTALASLGLLLDATAVVIGAMLVAPLMTPLIGAGFALTQGNLALFRRSLRAMSFGTLVGLGVAGAAGLITPNYEPTLEVVARTEVNILDLLVALLSGAAAAYAQARPKVIATMAGVAIAAALVPPLSVVGIGVAQLQLDIAGMAGVLFIANVVAIIVGASLVFRLLGVKSSLTTPAWARRALLLLVLATGILVVPLGDRYFAQGRQGQARPLNYPASPRTRLAVREQIESRPGVELITIGRVGVEPEIGVVIMLACSRPIDRAFEELLAQTVRDVAGPETPVQVIALLNAWSSEP